MSDPSYDSRANNPNVFSIIAYLTFIGWIAAYLLNGPSTPYSSFHLRQSLGINLLFAVSSMLFIIPVLGWITGIIGHLVGVLLWVLGLLTAIDGEQSEVPILGKYFQVWFAGL